MRVGFVVTFSHKLVGVKETSFDILKYHGFLYRKVRPIPSPPVSKLAPHPSTGKTRRRAKRSFRPLERWQKIKYNDDRDMRVLCAALILSSPSLLFFQHRWEAKQARGELGEDCHVVVLREIFEGTTSPSSSSKLFVITREAFLRRGVGNLKTLYDCKPLIR